MYNFSVSKLQSLITLITTEAEYVSSSCSLHDTIPIMDILDEVSNQKLFNCTYQTHVRCTAFKNNSGALELDMVPKICPRTKHINTKYHHLIFHVCKRQTKVKPVSTEEQIADIFTKPLGHNQFLHLPKKLMGW